MPVNHALFLRALGPLSLIFVLVATGCTVSDDSLISAVWENGPQGTWYRGDFHVHTSVGSNDTRYPDGTLRSWPDVVKQTAVERGMDFVVITDHSNSAGGITTTTKEDDDFWNKGPEFPLWDTAAALSDASFLMIDGSEISPVSTLNEDICEDCETIGSGELTPVGHIGCFPADLATFDLTTPFTDRPPGQVQGKKSIDECHALGGLAIVNHPFPKIAPWTEYDWTSYEYDAIEVYNGGVAFDIYDRAAYDAYLCDRLAGRPVVAVGGSDNHRTTLRYEDEVAIDDGPPLGLPMTTILADKFDWASIVAGFKKGRVVVHEDATFVEFRIFSVEGYEGTVGDSIDVSGLSKEVVVTFRGTTPVAQNLQFWRVAPDSCQDKRQPGKDFEPVVDRKVVWSSKVEGEFEHEARIGLSPGLYFATVGDFDSDEAKLNIRNIALTNVLTVVP